MDDLNFVGALPDEILGDLIDATQWLAKQYREAIDLLPQSLMIKAFTGDAQAKLFFEAGSQHLVNLANSAASLKSQPVPALPQIGMLLPPNALPAGNQEMGQGGEPGQ